MTRRTTSARLGRVSTVAGWLTLFLIACSSEPQSQGDTPEAAPAPSPVPSASEGGESAPTSAGALLPDERETLEFLRMVLAEEGHDQAREFLKEVVADLGEPAADALAAHIAYLLELDRLAEQLGSEQELRVVRERTLTLQSSRFPPDHPAVLAARQTLGATLATLGDDLGASEHFQAVVDARTLRSAPDDPDLLRAKLNLATILRRLGDLEQSRELAASVHEAWTRLLPPDHADLMAAKMSLASALAELGDFEAALELEELVFETRKRVLPADHPHLMMVMLNLASTRKTLGDFAGAKELEEVVLQVYLRTLPADHPHLLVAKQNLGSTRHAAGDFAGAQAIAEEVLEARTRLLPPDHPELLAAKVNLAAVRWEVGDFAGAKELFEAVLDARRRSLPPDHPRLLFDMLNLAALRYELGELEPAHELFEAVLAARARFLPDDHPDLLAAKQNLAITRLARGDVAGARELQEAVLAARTRSLAPDHPELLDAQQNLAATRLLLGDLAGARELDQAVLEARARVLPADHPLRLRAQQSLAATLGLLGDKEGARELVASLLAAMRSRALALQCEAPRLAREGAYIELRRFPDAFQLCDLVDPEHTLERELFATLETTRLAASAGLDASHALREDAGLAAEMREIARTRSQLNDLAASGPLDVDAAQSWRDELFALSEKRDRAERELRRKLAAAGAKQTEIDADALGRRLAPGTAALSFLRYARHSVQDPVTGARTPSTDALVAFVVKPGGSVARVDLGPTAELETLVQDWRAALGRPLGARGIGVEVRDGGLEGRDDPALIGARLRERVLDPLLAILPDVRALHVVLDDMLHLVPLDALPLGSGLVGERIAIHLEVSLARLLGPQAEPATEGVLLVAGGLAYDAEPGASLALGATIPPFQLGALRSGAATFAFLPGTVTEAESVARLYSEAFERDALELIGSAGTKAALHAAATEVRFLHLATHGWFAGEGLRSRLDPTPGSGADEFARAEETRTGFAPETLCGLALSGANRGADDLGRVVGILTAEELASFDLHNCELAVLSACETNVGLRRAGQGIQSLQAALHAAGARSSITSLWKVDDAATRRLFEHFYAKLWSQRLAKHEALWQAKMALRAEGLPPRDWAAWVLSGDQD